MRTSRGREMWGRFVPQGQLPAISRIDLDARRSIWGATRAQGHRSEACLTRTNTLLPQGERPSTGPPPIVRMEIALNLAAVIASLLTPYLRPQAGNWSETML